ncbi:MAG: hypothetical protein H9855_08945 [Candidatus Acinetobacter avistercoris]|uniref:DUF6176 family protein n=1 Tax=Acinetobacter sp. KS-LM10 TaxID=3120518 RepID=UPI001FA42F0D|nr:hypothetical protein [Candidatus Acinetobacter avistercoris]
MDIGAVLIKLKPNALYQVDTWQNELNARKQEALETLVHENVYVESWFHVSLEGQDYLIAYMRADDIARAQEIGRKSQFPIDQIHKAFKQNWEKVIPATLLVDLENQK